MAQLQNFEMSILSEGNKLIEHDNPDDPSTESEIVKYVAATAGARYQIAYKTLPSFRFGDCDYIFFRTYIDGLKLPSPVLPKSSYVPGYSNTITRDGVLVGSGENSAIQEYTFGSLDISDDERFSSIHPHLKNLGTIKIDVWRSKGGLDPKQSLTIQGDLPDKVNEKALKGGAKDLVTKLGEKKKIEPISVYSGTEIDSRPIATFIFKYRSKQALQQLHIIPTTPEPTPLEERDVETLTVEELRELVRRQKAAVTASKMENSGGDRKVKRERDTTTNTPPNLKKERAMEPEVVELSD